MNLVLILMNIFSSPHLIEARERIRINGELLSKEKFVEYFWICYNTIQRSLDKVIQLRQKRINDNDYRNKHKCHFISLF